MPQIRTDIDIPPADQKLPLHKRLSENLKFFERVLGIGQSFDMVKRELSFAGHDMCMIYINGFVKDDILDELLRNLSTLKREQLAVDAFDKLFKTYLPHVQVEKVDTSDQIFTAILSGQTCLLVDGYEQAFLIDARSYPARTPSEPELERVVRGSRDGFVETMVQNCVLTRRRIRDPRLRMETLKIGTRSKTDVCVAYIQDVADLELVKEIKHRLSKIEIDGIPMSEKTVEEFLIRKNRYNPYPVVRYTERPDVAANHLLEGHVLVYVDTSPSVMITPTTLFHHVQHAEEFRENPIIGVYIRWIRFAGILTSMFLIPLWILFTLIHREWMPTQLEFLGPETVGAIPIILQFLIAEIGIDLMRMAAIHTPTPLATAMGLVAAVLIGDIAVKVGLFSPETILYLAVSAIGTFATPSYELSMANKLCGMIFIFAVGVFDWIGLVIAVGLWALMLLTTKSINRPYLWPLIPFNAKAMLNILVRAPMRGKAMRPSIVHPRDKDRQPN
ncbi:spore germination protein [Tumebacillus permanentifrigoris]|uniref:Stage V sporulation protein AF n=1 Tax=Tumebacillus permanentifrigoris TaxID=378543 RepID=A0A316DC37_9BACL|nr:spore germination protein [Tumebacillus permanentifrigoris]PWK14466.1 stage V sporulation protein AF [Tumebacillus permanentifrigoris]